MPGGGALPGLPWPRARRPRSRHWREPPRMVFRVPRRRNFRFSRRSRGRDHRCRRTCGNPRGFQNKGPLLLERGSLESCGSRSEKACRCHRGVRPSCMPSGRRQNASASLARRRFLGRCACNGAGRCRGRRRRAPTGRESGRRRGGGNHLHVGDHGPGQGYCPQPPGHNRQHQRRYPVPERRVRRHLHSRLAAPPHVRRDLHLPRAPRGGWIADLRGKNRTFGDTAARARVRGYDDDRRTPIVRQDKAWHTL